MLQGVNVQGLRTPSPTPLHSSGGSLSLRHRETGILPNGISAVVLSMAELRTHNDCGAQDGNEGTLMLIQGLGFRT